MNLQASFEKFRQAIEPTDHERERVIASHTHLRQNILQRLNYVKNTILTGSYKRRTIIRPINDVDVFVVLNYQPGAYGNPTPRGVLNRLKQDVSVAYPNSTIKQDKPCLALEFEHCTFELTPAIEGKTWGASYYEIPKLADLNYWQRVDNPDILGEQLTRANQQNPMLIPLIKCMKRCKQNNKLTKPRSFEMELLAIRHLDYISSYRDGVIKLLEIYGWLNWDDLQKVRMMADDAFSDYCRNVLFGSDFPRY